MRKEISDTLLLSILLLTWPTYVRPILEYASIVWSPYVKTDVARLEMIQCKAACFVFNNSTYSMQCDLYNVVPVKLAIT